MATIEKKITSEIMQCIRTILVFETVNCFLDIFFQKSKTYKHITHSSDNSIISVKLYFVQYGFLLRPGHGPIYEWGGGQGRKPKLREEQSNERHKSSENAQEK